MKGRLREITAELKSSIENFDEKAAIDFLVNQLAAMSHRLETVEADMTAVTQFEKLRDVIVDRYATTAVLTLPSSVVLMANEFVDVSDGMYALEYGEDGTAYRWTRAAPPARFSIWIDRSRPIVIKLTVVSMGKVGKDEKLLLDVDGEMYELGKTKNRNVLQAGPLPTIPSNGPTDLLLVVPVEFAPSTEGQADKRSLGIAVSRLEACVAEDVRAPKLLASRA